MFSIKFTPYPKTKKLKINAPKPNILCINKFDTKDPKTPSALSLFFKLTSLLKSVCTISETIAWSLFKFEIPERNEMNNKKANNKSTSPNILLYFSSFKKSKLTLLFFFADGLIFFLVTAIIFIYTLTNEIAYNFITK